MTFLSIQYLSLGIGLLVPILLIEKYDINQRITKRLARIATGIGLGVSFSAFMLHPDIIIKFVGLIITIGGFYTFKAIRRTKQKVDKCQTCADHQSHKICYGLLLESEAMRKYSEYASDLLQADLKAAFAKKIQSDA